MVVRTIIKQFEGGFKTFPAGLQYTIPLRRVDFSEPIIRIAFKISQRPVIKCFVRVCKGIPEFVRLLRVRVWFVRVFVRLWGIFVRVSHIGFPTFVRTPCTPVNLFTAVLTHSGIWFHTIIVSKCPGFVNIRNTGYRCFLEEAKT